MITNQVIALLQTQTELYNKRLEGLHMQRNEIHKSDTDPLNMGDQLLRAKGLDNTERDIAYVEAYLSCLNDTLSAIHNDILNSELKVMTQPQPGEIKPVKFM